MKILLGLTELNQKFGALCSQHGLSSISAVLKKNGYTDISLSHFSKEAELDKWQDDLARMKPDIVGFYSTAEQFPFVARLIEQVPKGIFTICGGPHTTCYPECIDTVPRLDAVCIGEGEYAMLELVEALKSGMDYTHIKSLWVQKDGNIIKNQVRPFIENLDELPYADRELFDTQKAIDQYGMSQMRVLTTRGCPYQCTYCANRRISQAQSGHYVRYRSAKHIMGELIELKKKFNFKEIFFDDDIFMMNKDIRGEFCDRYLKEIDKPFVFCGRVEMCEKEMLVKLKQAGGRRIDFGLESGNEDIRKTVMKRHMTNKQIVSPTRMAKEAGLQIKTLNMVGLPEETVEKHWDTVLLNREIQPDVVSMSIFCPYPGTELYDYCIKKKYFDPDAPLPKSYISRRESLLNLPNFSRKDISKCFRWFGFRVFLPYSKLRAIACLVIYSRYGELAIDATTWMRSVLQKVFTGF